MDTGGMERFQMLGKLGSGAYGAVFKAFDKLQKKDIALKIIAHRNKAQVDSAYREISCAVAIPEHPNIAKLIHTFMTQVKEGTASILVFELMEGDLDSYIGRVHSVPLDMIKHLMQQLLEAIDHCHQNRIMHRDLKPGNLLLDKKMNLKVTDFGLGYPMVHGISQDPNVVTMWYRAPELLLGSTWYSGEVDLWSIGCIFAELITGRVLFRGMTHIDQVTAIFAVVGTPTEQTWPGLSQFPVRVPPFPMHPPQNFPLNLFRVGDTGMDLLEQLLTANPMGRISAAEALQHAYFRN